MSVMVNRLTKRGLAFKHGKALIPNCKCKQPSAKILRLDMMISARCLVGELHSVTSSRKEAVVHNKTQISHVCG